MQTQSPWKPLVDLLLSDVKLFPSGEKQKAKKPPTSMFTLEGRLSPGQHSKYAINGQDFVLNEDTWVVGVPKLGVVAKVSGTVRSGQHFAKTVRVLGAC